MEAGNTQWAKALTHPTRIAILMTLNAPKRRLSPREYADLTGSALPNVSYHFRCLQRAEMIELVETRPVRGSMAHFYESTKRAMAWTREYAALAPVVKQNLAATALRGAVESIGAAVDTGDFDSRPDAHLSYDTMHLDEQGWEELTVLLNDTLATAMTINHRAAKRGGDFAASFLLSCWPVPSDSDAA